MKSSDIYSLFEAQQELFEVEMSPSNLRKLAAAIPGVKVGMEFEMVVPGAQGEDDDYEPEEDMDADESADDIDDIIRFFGHEDDYMGQVNDPSDLRDLQEELREKYYEWLSEKVDELWQEDGKEYFEKWVKENVDPDDVAEYVGKEPDLLGDTVPDEDDYETFINDQWDEGFGNKNYDRAYEEFREENEDGYRFDENDFLREIGIRYMSDVNDNVRTYIRWPHYTEGYGSDGGEDIESVADDFSDAIGKRVYSSTSYHGARRAPDAYSLEPDSSIDASSGEAGLEFISPPQDVDEMLEDLKKVKEWAKARGAYTNRSTGLHINVSVPDYSLDKLDYVKLAVLLGDKYVLEQFGRLSNGYAKSALDIIKDRAKDNEDVDRLLKQLKNNVEGIASKILHSGRTDKYTSINTKDGYVEFRSAGGDWLDRNFDKIEDTLLRNIVALDAACDPEKYKKEYLKGLYKVLKPEDDGSMMSMFAKYQAGAITLDEYAKKLEEKRKERFKGQGIGILHKDDVEENDWEITYDDGKKNETIYIANTAQVPNEEAAFKAAQKFKPQWFKPDTIEYITVKPFKFSEDLEGLKLYRAEFGHRYSSVVAKNEKEAREFVRIMNPELFEVEPDREISLTDEEASKRKISQMLPWQEQKLEQGREYIKRPKVWVARGRGSIANRYYIAAVGRDEAIEIANRLDPDIVQSQGFDIYVTDATVDQDTYDAYRKAQEDLISEREARERQAQEPEIEVPLDSLKVYRITNNELNNGYMYVVAENGGEAAEIAGKMDPDKFGSIAALTAQEQHGGTFGPLVITNLYKYQQRKMSETLQQSSDINIPAELQPSQPPAERSFYVTNRNASIPGPRTIIVSATSPDEAYHAATNARPEWSIRDLDVSERSVANPQPPRLSDMQSFRVQNVDTGESRYFAASDLQDAINRAREQYPAMFPQGAGLYATPHEPGPRR